MSTVFLYTMPIILHDQTKMRCRFHFAELLSFVDAPLAGSKTACTTLANILLKAHILNVSDKEKSGMPQEARQALQLMIDIGNIVIDIVL